MYYSSGQILITIRLNWHRRYLVYCKRIHTFRENLVYFKSFSNIDRNIFLEKINNISQRDLDDLGVSPNLVKKLMKEKSAIHNFTHMSELQVCDFDIPKSYVLNNIIEGKSESLDVLQNILIESSKDISVLCDFDIESNEAEDEGCEKPPQKGSRTRKKTKYANQKFHTSSSPIKDDLGTITGLNITYGCMAWTTLSSEREIVDMGCLELLPVEDKKQLSKSLKNFDLYQKVSVAVKSLPKSDLVVFESSTYSSLDPLKSRFNYILTGMLLSLLDGRDDSNQLHPLVFLNASLVPKLFGLMVGEERVSGMGIGESILVERTPLKWIPAYNSDSKALRKYILSDYSEKLHMIDSLLVTVAFHLVVLRNFPPAIIRL